MAVGHQKRWNEFVKRSEKRLKRWQKAWNRSTFSTPHSYAILALVFMGVTVAALERAAAHHDMATSPAVLSNGLQDKVPSEPAMSDPLAAKPWTFFHPSWDSESLSLFPVENKVSPLADELPTDLAKLLDDPKDRLEKEFKVPPFLRDRVLFWMQVHALYNNRMRVVHDRANPSIVYGYIDLRPLYRVLGPGRNVEHKSNEIEKKIIRELKAKLSEAADNTTSGTSPLSIGEKTALRNFLSRVGALSPAGTAALIANMRTQTGQSDEFLQALHRSKNLLPHIESVFRRQGLPVALGRIPFVESSFNVRAHSKVGAVGIWQFMPETARQMIRGDSEKAWADPLKQTASAAKILKIFRSLVPDWGMAITSYNSGVGRIQRLAKKYKLKSVDGLIGLQSDEGLGFAGKNFYAQFLSANLVEAYKEEIFNRLLEPADYMLVLKEGMKPFPRESCDL